MVWIVVNCLLLAQFVLPRSYAFVPLVIATMHLGNVELVPELTPCRLIILAGLARWLLNGGRGTKLGTPLDKVFLCFACVALLVSIAPREDIASPFRANVGMILNVCGSFLYGRIYLGERDSLMIFSKVLCISSIPLAMGLFGELVLRKNLYAGLGALTEGVTIRNGTLRATGPFGHPILCGSLGASIIPLAIGLWSRVKWVALLGVAAGLVITYLSGSSGPLAALMAGFAAIFFWNYRAHLSLVLRGLFVLLVVLHLVSTRGVWYLMTYIDIVGGSTGWHRAKLIDSCVKYFSDWWLAGTDHTRHWMPSGVHWSPLHTDMTNYYVHLGVIGGLGLVICLIACIGFGFRGVGAALSDATRAQEEVPETRDELTVIRGTSSPPSLPLFAIWCLGCSLLVHAISFISISYFDQMFSIFYLTIGLIAGMGLSQTSSHTENDHERERAPV